MVQDQSGAIVSGAEVRLTDGSAQIAKSMTDSNGRFQIEGVTSVDSRLIVRAPGFAPFERKLIDAQSNSPEIEIVLAPAPLSEQVTVTATRTETRLGDTAASIATLNRTDVAMTAAITLDDTLRQVPGFSLFRRSGSRTANPTSQGVSLRGVGASGASRAVVLADGLALNDPFGGWIYWSRVPRTSINNIEVLRGGASHLYGSAALGGVINIITRQPQSPVMVLESSYGNDETANGSLFLGGRKGRWGGTLAAESFRTNGYVIVTESGRGPVDIPANSRNAVVNFALERSFSSVGRAFASASFFGESRSNGTPLQTNRTHVRRFVIGGDFDTNQAGRFSLRASAGTQLFDQNFSTVGPDRRTETMTRLQRVPAQSTAFSVQWSRQVGKRQTLVAGFEAREVRGASDEIVFVGGRASSLVGAGGRERSVGIFVEDIVQLSQNLFLTAGVRLDRWRNFDGLAVTRPLSTPAQGATIAFTDRAETAFSPQLSVLYRPRNSFALYASMSRAFRAPTLNELYRSFRVGDVLTLANEDLLAERLTGGEAGTTFSSFDQRLNMRATFFWAEVTRPVANVTVNVQPGLITRQRQNLGRTGSRGFEFETDARVSNRWTITGGYLFANATVLSFDANTSLVGLQIPQVPRHQLTFQARYLNPSLISIGLQGRASSAQFDDDQNRFRLDRYLTIDALVSRRFSNNMEGFIAAENLLSQRYAIGLTPVKTIGPPLLMRVGFRLHLGSQ